MGKKHKPKMKYSLGKKTQNRLSMILVSFVVIMIIVVVGISSISLVEKKKAQEATIANLQAEIDEENARTQDIEEYTAYTQTKKFVEDVARDTLGLVYEDEINFKKDE